MRFLTPNALWLIAVPVAAILYFALKRRRPGNRVAALSLPIPEVLSAARRARWAFRAIFVVSCASLACLAVAVSEPVRRLRWIERWSEGIDIAIVLDVSESMDATDFTPNRMEVAKQVVREFIRGRQADRIGLVMFGGEAVTKCPLTRDYDFLLRQLADVQMRELKQGTAIGMALANGVARLQSSDAKTKVIVLITDGDSNVGAINPITAATLAREEKIRIYSVGIGKETRVLVPIYAYDLLGNKTHLLTHVPSYINPELLQQISKLTGGKSYMATDPKALRAILSEIDQLEKSKVKLLPRQKDEPLYLAWALPALVMLFGATLLQETRYRRARLAAKH